MTIETERLRLRPFQEGDAEHVFEYLNEPAVNCFASMKLHSIEEARETGFGIAWFLGSWLLGALYDIKPLYLVAISMVAQLLAIVFYVACIKVEDV